jgi:hypothetical protein
MTSKATLEDMHSVLEPITARHYTPAEHEALAKRPYDQAEIGRQWQQLMDKGDPTSSAAHAGPALEGAVSAIHRR